MKKEEVTEVTEVTEVKKVFELSEITNSQASILIQVYGKMFNADFTKDEFDDALVISEEGILIEDSMKAYGKLEKSILDKAEKLRGKDGMLSVEVVNKVQDDLKELSEKKVKLSKPLSDTIKKHIKKVSIKPKEIKILKDLNLI